jgi:hypothetical protein
VQAVKCLTPKDKGVIILGFSSVRAFRTPRFRLIGVAAKAWDQKQIRISPEKLVQAGSKKRRSSSCAS